MIMVFEAGSLPVAGIAGLGALVGALGAIVWRRRRK